MGTEGVGASGAPWTGQADRSEGWRPSWSHRRVTAVRTGLLRLAEALTFRGDVEGVSSTVRALVTTLRSGEKCSLEPELVSKGTRGPASEEPSPAAPRRGPTLTRWATPCGSRPSLCCGELVHVMSPYPGLTSSPYGSSSLQGSSRATTQSLSSGSGLGTWGVAGVGVGAVSPGVGWSEGCHPAPSPGQRSTAQLVSPSPAGSDRGEVALPGGDAGCTLPSRVCLAGLQAHRGGHLPAAAGQGGAPGPGAAGH